MKWRGGVAWAGMVMCGGEWLTHQWERVTWFISREWKEFEEDLKYISSSSKKKNMSIKEVIKSMTSDKIELRKGIQVADPD